MDIPKPTSSGPIDLFMKSVRFVADNFAAISGVTVPMLVVYVISQVLFFYAREGRGNPAVVIGSMVFAVLWIAVSGLGYIAIFRSAAAILAGTRVEPEAAYRDAVKIFWPFVGVGIATGFFVVAGYFALFVPGIVLTVYLVFATPLLILEKKKIGEAILQSIHLVKDRWFQVAGNFFVTGIFLMLILLAVVSLSVFVLGNFDVLIKIIVVAVTVLVTGPISSVFSMLYLRELQSTSAPMIDLDKTNYKQALTAISVVGGVGCLGLVFLIYRLILDFVLHGFTI